MTDQRGPDGVSVMMFALATTLGGANFLAVRFSNRELPPFWGASLRFGLAALLFAGIVVALRLALPRGKQLGLTVLYGVLAFALSYALMYWALLTVTAGVATIVLASVPLLTLLLAAGQGLESVRPRNLLGALLALAGITWMSAGPGAVSLPGSALLTMAAAALTIAQSMILSKRIAANHPAVINAVGMSVGALLLLVFSAVAGESWALPRTAESAWAVLYLVTLGSGGLFVLVLLVVRRWTASATSYMFVLFPVVTLLLGAVIADEPLTLDAAIGAAVVMAGVWFGALSPGARVAAAAAPAARRPAAG